MKTLIEIIQETVKFYSEDPQRRATGKYTCRYEDEKGNNCAVGRCLITPSKFDNLQYSSIDNLFKHKLISLNDFKEEYRIDLIEFWEELQTFHDNIHHFNESGLSLRGIDFVNYLLEKYK